MDVSAFATSAQQGAGFFAPPVQLQEGGAGGYVGDSSSEDVTSNSSIPPEIVKKRAARETYLLETLGLKYDPFVDAYAEAELKAGKDDPPFFSYCIEPPTEPAVDSILEKLNQPQPAFVFGEAGSGKTALRFMLEADGRSQRSQTLTVSHVIGKDHNSGENGPARPPNGTWGARPLTAGPEPAPWAQLTIDLAIDLLIQVVERFHAVGEPEPAVLTESTAYWQAHVPHFTSILQRHLPERKSSRLTGISEWWWLSWGRPIIINTPFTAPLRSFLQKLASAPHQQEREGGSRYEFARGLALAQALGYKQVYLLVDAAGSPPPTKWITHLWPLSELLDWTTPIPLFPKFFLPLDLKDEVENWLDRLTLTPFSVTIKWDQVGLARLIAERFRSAGSSWIRGFDVLASREIDGRLHQGIIDAAKGSPRRLLQLISALIEAHAGRAPDELDFTAGDWQTMRRQWSSPPTPPPLTPEGT